MGELSSRQYVYYDDDNVSWWYSSTAIIIKWTVAAVILAVIFIYFCGGYIHAKSRLSKGLPPLRYHRWMVRRQMAPQAYNAAEYHQGGMGPAGGYNNHGGYSHPYQAPPPIYNPHNAPPPSYYPNNMHDIPLNATKAAPNQNLPSQQVSGVIGGETSGSRH